MLKNLLNQEGFFMSLFLGFKIKIFTMMAKKAINKIVLIMKLSSNSKIPAIRKKAAKTAVANNIDLSLIYIPV